MDLCVWQMSGGGKREGFFFFLSFVRDDRVVELDLPRVDLVEREH